jgi:hypothetical protein
MFSTLQLGISPFSIVHYHLSIDRLLPTAYPFIAILEQMSHSHLEKWDIMGHPRNPFPSNILNRPNHLTNVPLHVKKMGHFWDILPTPFPTSL